MKSKNGKVVLGKNDTRIGNFVITKETNHYKLQDVGGFWSIRISQFLMGYTVIDECIKSGSMEYLEALVKVYYAVTTTPPDTTMMSDMFTAYSALIDRMREKIPQVSEQEQQQILDDMEKSMKNKDILVKAIEDGDPANQKG